MRQQQGQGGCTDGGSATAAQVSTHSPPWFAISGVQTFVAAFCVLMSGFQQPGLSVCVFAWQECSAGLFVKRNKDNQTWRASLGSHNRLLDVPGNSH